MTLHESCEVKMLSYVEPMVAMTTTKATPRTEMSLSRLSAESTTRKAKRAHSRRKQVM